MAKKLKSDTGWRAPQLIECVVEDCGATTTVPGSVVPSGWRETKQGLICPRHKLIVVVEDDLPEDVIDEALKLN